jgi:hypothetical protein
MSYNKLNNYKSTLTIVVGFVILSNYFHSNYLLILAITIGIIGMFSESANFKIIWIWEKLTEFLAYIMPNLLLAIVFYFFLTPLAFINSLFRRKNTLLLKNTSNSTFISKKKIFSPESLEKIW